MALMFVDICHLPKAVVHRIEHNAKLGDLIGVESRGILSKISLTLSEQMSQVNFLRAYGLEDKGYIAFIVGSIAPTRRWFPKNFAQVAAYITQSLHLKVVILGGPNAPFKRVAGKNGHSHPHNQFMYQLGALGVLGLLSWLAL